VRLPVSYNKAGKTVAANATLFSPKGCLVLTKKPHRVGTVFSLRITNARADTSIQVDGSVCACKHFAADRHWGMSIRFMNLSEMAREELRRLLAAPAPTPKTSIRSKYLDTWKEFLSGILSQV
jgi:hypothetical protein